MSQTVITLAFEHWKAQQAINNSAVVLDEFVLANVPNLNIDSPIDRAEQIPEAKYIVHRQAVSAAGLVNENSVVYSVTMGADVGDFEFNWVGLVNKATGTLAMIVHAPLQSKIKNAEGKQGNVLTRSFLMEYNGAATETQITTPAETWQIDFTARLAGMDERQRLENVDIYGAAAFFGDGFLVTRQVSQYGITQGIGYVGGLRCKLPTTQNITVTTKPVKVWVDVCWKGTLTSVWAESLKITVANTLADYVQDGVQHYVFAVASIDANGVITDLRPKGTLDNQQGNKVFLRIDKDLSEIQKRGEAAQKKAVDNLGLTQTVELADGGLQKDKNLSDVPDKGKARANLGLIKQTSPTDTTSGAVLLVEAGGLLSQAPAALSNSDILARNFAAQFFRQGGGTNGNHFGGYGAGIHLPYDTSGTTPVSANLFVTSDGRLHVEFATGQTFILGDVYSTVHKPTASDVGALPSNGNAVSATKLATARKIAGKAFDGTADIVISAGDVAALPINGGALNGALAINSAGRALAIIGDDDKALYFQARDKSGAARWFVGNAGDGDSTVSFHNYKNGTKLDLSNEAGFNKSLNVNGKVTPSDYANFDAKYSKIATISKSANGYEKDNNTGRIRQWGRTAAFGAGNGYPLKFPIPFPNVCTGVTVTLIRSVPTTQGSSETSYVGEPGLSGVQLYHGGTEVYPAFWEAVGY